MNGTVLCEAYCVLEQPGAPVPLEESMSGYTVSAELIQANSLPSTFWFSCYLTFRDLFCPGTPPTPSHHASLLWPAGTLPLPLPTSFSHTSPTLLAEPRPPLQAHLTSVSMNHFSQMSLVTSFWTWPGSQALSLSPPSKALVFTSHLLQHS